MKYATSTKLSVDEETLMLKKDKRPNDPNSGFYTIPGGKILPSERGTNPLGRLKCAVREYRQETGLILLDPVFRGTILFDNEGRTFPDWPTPDDFLVYFFSAGSYRGNLRKRVKEGVPLWVPDSKIDELPQNPGDRKIYEWLNDGRFFAGVIKHKGDELDERNTFVDYLGMV